MTMLDLIMGDIKEFDMLERNMNLILFLVMIVATLSGVANVVTGMTFYNYLVPFAFAVTNAICYSISRLMNKPTIARILLMLIMAFVFTPVGWLTTAGSKSAFVYYSISMIIVNVFLVNKIWEHIIPMTQISVVIYLMYYEVANIDKFYQYTSELKRIQDISIHYVVNTMIILSAVILLKQKYIKEHNKYIELSSRDSLTGLYNRRYIIEKLSAMYQPQNSNDEVFSVVMIDLDNFKSINDIYGHLVGDEVLIELSKIMMKNASSRDVCGRYGGDEFIVIMKQSDLENAKVYSEKVLDEFNKYANNFKKTKLSLSYGIANSESINENEIISVADDKLYESKNKKKEKTNN